MQTKKRLSFYIKGVSSVTLALFLMLNFVSPVLAQTVGTTSSGTQLVSTGFSDVNRTHPNYTAITYLSQKGVIGGYADGTFKPDNAINRAEVLKIILSGSGIETDEAFGAHFPDVTEGDWFAPYVMKARAIGFVKGNDADGTFTPGRQVNMAEFLKMLLVANGIDVSAFEGKQVASNIPLDAWYANYVNYAVALGIAPRDSKGNVDAAKLLTRGEVVDMMYLLSIIQNGSDTQFLLTRAESEMAQIEVYIAANMVAHAKNASDLAVDLTQQAYKNMPTNNVVLGAAKIARAYDWLVDSFILGIQGDNEGAAKVANDAIDKATEAWEANNATQPIAKHIKDRAREILQQVGGVET
ncbi:S-layer homology domain-containing protein [Candidatus Peregrinibacteria bacterium]|nr:S-layer homology domain-containing protein [Candidatus Peregrinibacteria bacterium]